MSPLKHTNKMRQLRAIVDNNPTFKGIDLNETHWTNEAAIALMYGNGYSWSSRRQEWFYSPQRVAKMAVRGNIAHDYAGSSRRVIVRLLGPKDTLAQIAGDFAEVCDLIGLKPLSVSQVKENDDNSTWGRIYITCEVL